MATKTFQVTHYAISLNSKQLLRAQSQDKPIQTQAFIQCFGANEEYLKLFFINPEQVGNPNSDNYPNWVKVSEKSTIAEMFIPSLQYAWYIDLLRNEHPVFASLESSAPNQIRLWCDEPVGEGEIYSKT